MMSMGYHNPVMLQECLDGLNIRPDGRYVDVTFGGGGHSRAILAKLNGGHLYSFDQDTDALANDLNDDQFTLVHHNFRYLKRFLRYHDAIPVDGILADLGVSSHQFDTGERGFSIRFDGELDMRMDQDRGMSARELVATAEEADLANILYRFGELKNARQVAKKIVEVRAQREIITVNDLLGELEGFMSRGKENKFKAQLFQALRIEVNEELRVLEEMLEQTLDVLAPGGRLVVMSYHSLEDRIVKNFMKSGKLRQKKQTMDNPFENQKHPFKLITRQSVGATEEEIEENPRARSARLRIAEKI